MLEVVQRLDMLTKPQNAHKCIKVPYIVNTYFYYMFFRSCRHPP